MLYPKFQGINSEIYKFILRNYDNIYKMFFFMLQLI